MADACSRYLPFVKTTGGLTPDDPIGLFASSFDYREWLTLDEQLLGIFESNVDKLQNEAGATEWPAVWEGFKERFDKLAPWWLFVPAIGSSTVGKAKDLAVDIACKLGELEDDMRRLEVEPSIPFRGLEPPTTTGEKVVETVGDIGKAVAAGFILWLFLGRRD